MSLPTIKLRDLAGFEHEFELMELYEQLRQGKVRLFGMDLDAILACRKYYQIYNGPDPMTGPSVEKIFKDLRWVPDSERFEFRKAEYERVKGRNLLPCPYRQATA